MNITRLAVDNNRLTVVAILAVILFGIQTFNSMPRAYDPGFIMRAAQVVTYFPGAAPERVELLISAKLEDAIKEIPELDFVKSESRTGVSIVTVNISESYTEMRPVWDDLRRKVESVETQLPDGVVGPFVNDEFGDVFGIVVAITGEGFDYRELHEVAEALQAEIQRLADAAKVEIYGAQDERVFVEYDNARLAELGVSPYRLSRALETRNIVIPGGSFKLGHERIYLEPSGNFESLEDIGDTILQIPGSDKLVYLKDISRLSRGYIDPPQSIVHSSGARALGIGVAMREGGNNIELGKRVKAVLEKFNQIYPHGIEFELVNFSPGEVERKVRDFTFSLVQAVVVVTLVMLIALGLRAGFIVAALIPLAMLSAIIVMSALDIGLDQVSLAALIIALGMLVDNGIVMSENIMVQIQKGKTAYQAALDAATELRLPLLTASLTTAAAFLPIYLAESNVGEFTASLFKVVSITLLASWLIALTVIPMLCVAFLRAGQHGESYKQPVYRIYRHLLRRVLAHRYSTLTATAAIFVVAMLGFSLLPKVFFPPSDREYFKVELALPTGTSIERTEQVVADMESFMSAELTPADNRERDIVNWISYIGNAGPRFILSHNPKPSDPGFALMIVNVADIGRIDELMHKIDQYAFEHFPDLEVTLRHIENGPSIDNPVEIRLSGTNDDELFSAAAELKTAMARLGGLRNISDDWGQRIKKLVISVDQENALRAGVTSQDIAVSLQAGLSGVQLTEYRRGEDVIPVLMRSTASREQDVGVVESLSVYAQASGRSLPLRQVADVDVEWDAARIYRRDGVRTITIGAQLVPGVTASEKFMELERWLDDREDWTGVVRYEFGGERETSEKSNRSIIEKLPVAGLIILALLVGQFNSMRKALIVLITIPLGLIGVVIGLLVARSFFGFMTLLGVISLAGIVINNAIVLLEKIQMELDRGVEHLEAVISAAQQRARPILLTTATTILGLIPLYLSGGEMWEPMTIAIMSGLLFSTILTLGVVPVLYAVLFRVR